MSKITVTDLSLMEDYATSITNFTQAYREGVSSTYRQFEAKAEGSVGEAISAYLSTLNTMQANVFDQFPTALETYSSGVTTYASAMTSLGFQKKAWTDSDGATSVGTTLTGQQKTNLSTTADSVQAALDKAYDAMEMDRVSVSSITESASGEFDTASQNRTSKDSDMQSAYTAMSEALPSTTNTIKAFQSIMDNAKYMVTIPVKTVVASIKSGSLTAERMVYLSSIQNKDDVKAAKLLLSEGDFKKKEEFFDKLGKIDYADKLSGGMMTSIYGRLFQEMHTIDESGHSSTLGAFFQSMTVNLSKEDATAYAEKLSNSSAFYADSLKKQAMGLMPQFPPSGSSQETYAQYYEKMEKASVALTAVNGLLKKASTLNNVFEYIYGYELGAQAYASGGQVQQTNFIKGDTLTFAHTDGRYNGVSFELISGRLPVLDEGDKNYYTPWKEAKGSFFYETNNISTNDVDTSNQTEIEMQSSRITELRNKQKKALQELVANTTVTLATAVNPTLGAIAGITKQSLMDADNTGATFKAVEEATGKSGTISLIENWRKFSDENDEIQQEIVDAQEKQADLFFDMGGTSVSKDGTKVKTAYNSTYDLEGALIKFDLEQNGLRAYIYRSAMRGKSPTDAYNAIKRFDNDYINNVNVSEGSRSLFQGNGVKVNNSGETGTISVREIYDNMMKMDRAGTLNGTVFVQGEWFRDNTSYYSDLVGNS